MAGKHKEKNPKITILLACNFSHPIAHCIDFLCVKSRLSCSNRADGGREPTCSWAGNSHRQVSGVGEFKTIHHCTALLFLVLTMAMGSGSHKEDSLGQIHSYSVILNCKTLG